MANEKLTGRKWLGNFAKWGKCPGDKRDCVAKRMFFQFYLSLKLKKEKFLKDLSGNAFLGTHTSHVHSLRIN